MEITSTLQRLCLQPTTQPHFHVLFLEYPVTTLLPTRPGIGLRMEPPKAGLYREIPNGDKYFLEEQGLDFSVRFPVTSRRPSHSKEHICARLSAAVDRLSQCGGRSALQAVTVSDDNHNESGYIFRMSTLWHDGSREEIHNFQISEREWQDLLSLSDLKPWTGLLRDLFSRASDRAYLHVERQLKGTEYFAIDALKWNAYAISTANQLLALNMREVREEATLLCLLPIRELCGNTQRAMTVRLPCEHETTVTIAYLKSLSWASCIDTACPKCGQAVLPNRDIMHAQHSAERRRRQRKALDQTLWKRVEATETEYDTRITASGVIICQALAHALQSLQVPESVSPRQLCPAWSVEAAAILDETRNTYAHSSEMFSACLFVVQARLVSIVDAALQECCGLRTSELSDHVLPGWSMFSWRWLKRTAGLLAIPGYAGEDVWAVFGEVPDEDDCFDDDNEMGKGEDVEIRRLLGGVSLL